MPTQTKSLKIGLVLDDSLDSADGVQQYVLTIGAWLSLQGHKVHYLVGSTKRTDIANLHSLSRNLRVRFNGNRMSMPLPTSPAAIKRFLNQQQFDVLHIQVPYSPFLAHRIIMAAPALTAIVGTFHILPYTQAVQQANRLLALSLRRSLNKFHAVVSVSSAAAVFAQKVYGLSTAVVPNAIDYQRFHNAQPFAGQPRSPQILFLGRLVERKGCGTLLKAINELRHNRPDLEYQVTICGKGPQADNLKHYVTDVGIDTFVTFAGFVSEADKPRYYASADIAVFPSSAGESFGIVLAEAMASGRTIVLAGDNPGYRAVLADQPDLLFPAKDYQLLAKKIAAYLDNVAQRRTLAAWGEADSRRYDVTVVGAQLEVVYRQALRKAREL